MRELGKPDPDLYGDKRLWQLRGCTMLGLVGLVTAATVFSITQGAPSKLSADAQVLTYQGSAMATSMGAACVLDALVSQ